MGRKYGRLAGRNESRIERVEGFVCGNRNGAAEEANGVWPFDFQFAYALKLSRSLWAWRYRCPWFLHHWLLFWVCNRRPRTLARVSNSDLRSFLSQAFADCSLWLKLFFWVRSLSSSGNFTEINWLSHNVPESWLYMAREKNNVKTVKK